MKIKKNLLMAVFNPIEFDGRVKRAAETLSKKYNVVIFCPKKIGSIGLGLPKYILIKRSWLNWQTLPTWISLFLFWLQLTFIAFFMRPKILYVHDFYLSLPGLFNGKALRIKTIYDAHELIIPNRKTKRSWRDKFYYSLEKISIKGFDVVISANLERAKIMKRHYQLEELPVIIRNISKPTLGDMSVNTLIDSYPILNKLDEELFVVYMGDISLDRGLREVIDATAYLPEKIFLVVVGDGPDLVRIRAEVSLNKELRGRIRFLGSIPQGWIQDILSICDLGVVVYSMNGLNNFYCSPNKVYEYAQAGIPMISTSQPPLVDIIKRYKIGSVAYGSGSYPNAREFSVAIQEALENHDEYTNNLQLFLKENNVIDEQKKLLEAIQIKIS